MTKNFISQEIFNKLKSLAKSVSEKAYCPYSNYHVGAAVYSKQGNYYAGCNVENASYGGTICAERNAVCQMIAAGDREISAVVTYTPTETTGPPCGICRQFINEFADADVPIISYCNSNSLDNSNMKGILPNAFGPKNLDK